MFAAISAADKERDAVRGQHFGQPLEPGEPTGYEAASKIVETWIQPRHAL